MENYDSAYEKDDAVFGSKESHLLKKCAEVIPDGSRVLDLGIGQGRNALPLARRGCQVTGIDTSQVSVDTVNRLAAAEDLPMEAILQDFLRYEPDRSFDVVLCFGLMQMLDLQRPSRLDSRSRWRGESAKGSLARSVGRAFKSCAELGDRLDHGALRARRELSREGLDLCELNARGRQVAREPLALAALAKEAGELDGVVHRAQERLAGGQGFAGLREAALPGVQRAQVAGCVMIHEAAGIELLHDGLGTQRPPDVAGGPRVTGLPNAVDRSSRTA